MTSTTDSSLWSALLARLKASDMTEQDLRESSPSIQKQILIEILGFDIHSASVLMEQMRENRSGSERRSSPFFGRNNSSSSNNHHNHYLPSSSFMPRLQGSVDWREIEEALNVQQQNTNSSSILEVRQVSSIPSSAIPPAMEKEFRQTRIETGCQPERLFRFCSKKHLETVSLSGNIFDSYVPKFDCAVSATGQIIGRTFVTGFTDEDIDELVLNNSDNTKQGGNKVVVGCDVLTSKPVTMTMDQFQTWTSNLNDSNEAHVALAELGATCVQIVDHENHHNHHQKLVIFDPKISLLKVIAFTNVIRDSSQICAPAAIAARGCPRHDYRKFEFWNRSSKQLFCALCLYEQPDARDHCTVIDDAYHEETSSAHSFRLNLKSRQQQIAKTLSYLEYQQETFSERALRLRHSIEDTFVEIRRLVDLQEADVFSAFDLAVRGNAEDLSQSMETFQRYSTDCENYLRDADDALSSSSSSMGGRNFNNNQNSNIAADSVRVLALSQLSNISNQGGDLDLGRPDEHSQPHDLPEFEFDREAVLEGLRHSCRLMLQQQQEVHHHNHQGDYNDENNNDDTNKDHNVGGMIKTHTVDLLDRLETARQKTASFEGF